MPYGRLPEWAGGYLFRLERGGTAVNIESDGLVIKEQKIGESDKLITVLTSQYGLIRAFVRRASSMKSKMLGATQLLSYSDFSFYKGRSSYNVNSATQKYSFFKLNDNIEALAVGFYLAELFGELAPENENAETLLHLLLHSLYLMAEKKRTPQLVKAAAELRSLSDSGYMPDLVACANCGEYETDYMYFNPSSGHILCSKCGSPAEGMRLSLGAITAMRFIVYSEEKKIFNFHVSDQTMKELSQAAEQFAIQQTGRGYKTLEFYKSIPKG